MRGIKARRARRPRKLMWLSNPAGGTSRIAHHGCFPLAAGVPPRGLDPRCPGADLPMGQRCDEFLAPLRSISRWQRRRHARPRSQSAARPIPETWRHCLSESARCFGGGRWGRRLRCRGSRSRGGTVAGSGSSTHLPSFATWSGLWDSPTSWRVPERPTSSMIES